MFTKNVLAKYFAVINSHRNCHIKTKSPNNAY